MQSFKIFVLLTSLSSMVFTPIRARASFISNIAIDIPSTLGIEDRALDQNKEMTLFFRAKESLFKLDWTSAKKGLEQYLSDYPSGRMVDEALYWLAQCLNRISKAEKDTDRMIALREEAVSRVNELVGRFGNSLWVNDALVLRVEISRDLVLFGRTEFKIYLNPIHEQKRESYREVLIARPISELTKEAALPILLRICETDPSPAVRKKAIFLLAHDYRQDVIPFLQALSLKDPDEGVRREATSIIERIRMSLSPVQLNYYAFDSSLVDGSEFGWIQENKINLFTIPHGIPGEEGAKEAVWAFLGNRLDKLNFRGLHWRDLNYLSSSSEIWHSLREFGFNVVNPDLRKEPSRIIGTLRVFDRISKIKYRQTFSLDASGDKLFVMRRGKYLAMNLLQFEVQTGLQPEPVNRLREVLKAVAAWTSKSVYPMTFKNLLGCYVQSTRSNWDAHEQANMSRIGLLDLGQSRAEIPGLGGKWVLEGYLLCDQKARVFMGRQFTLINPQGKVIAKGAFVEVPADSPQAYRIK